MAPRDGLLALLGGSGSPVPAPDGASCPEAPELQRRVDGAALTWRGGRPGSQRSPAVADSHDVDFIPSCLHSTTCDSEWRSDRRLVCCAITVLFKRDCFMHRVSRRFKDAVHIASGLLISFFKEVAYACMSTHPRCSKWAVFHGHVDLD